MTPPSKPKPARRAAWPAALGLAALLLAGLLVGGPAGAQSAAQRGLAIAREADRRDRGWGDYRVELEMTLHNAAGQSAGRHMKLSVLERPGEGDMSLIVFDWPRDIEGTALLTHGHRGRDDDQWLYLPALKRTKRISGANKTGSFVGSEFAYEDLVRQEVEEFDWRYLREERCGELTCFVLARHPRDPDSGYVREVLWIDETEYRTHRIDYYDRKDSKLKTLTLKGYRRYRERFWRARELEMTNHQTGKSTSLAFGDYAFGTGLSARDFRKRALERQ